MQEEVERMLTPNELAKRLQVPVSWVYSRTRVKGANTIPMIRIGKYCRFVESEVLQWLKSQQASG